MNILAHRQFAALSAALMLAALTGCVSELPVDTVRLNAYDAYRAGDAAAARDQFAACVRRDPTDYKSHYYLGVIGLNQLNDPAYARRHLELALTLRDSRLRRPLVLESGLPETTVPYPSRADITDALAEALYRMGTPQQLFAFLRSTTDEYGEVSDYLRLAEYLAKSGDHDAAKNSYIQAIKVSPADDPTAELALADFYDAIGDRPAALVQLRAAYGIDPTLEGLTDRIRAHGLVPGPTIALPRQYTP
ncbi:tetratricopeptide repeat protein [Planctomycetales bacterium ZRK34]|nr:tetratricopeptide repeat protein [Planctomycetales bacterium ZRK34]